MRFYIRFTAGVFLLLINLNVFAEPLLFSSAQHPAAPRVQSILTATYHALGYDVEFVAMPIERRFIELERGNLDGDVAAREGLEQRYPHLRKVQPAIGIGKVVLVCRKNLECNKSILNNETQQIYSHSGLTAVIKEELGYNVRSELITLENPDTLLALFNKGRIDYFVFTDVRGILTTASTTPYLSVELGQRNLFHYVHARHSKLIPQISAELERQLHSQSEH